MRFVIVESPFASNANYDRGSNEVYLRRCLTDAIDRGEVPFASHALYPQVLEDSNPDQRAHGIMMNFEVTKRADAVVFYVDRGYSDGMLAAKANAQKLGIPTEERTILGHKKLEPKRGEVAEIASVQTGRSTRALP